MKNQNIYDQPITSKNIMKFALPTIAMSLFMSFYTMVDGLFVSNFIGTNALSAINLSAPIIALVTAISTMLATGGSALIMKKIGEQKVQEANMNFTFLIVVNILVGIIMCLIGYVSMDFVYSKMNLSSEVLYYSQEYLGYYLLFTIPILLMNNFSLYLIASGKSSISFICSVAGGIVNIVLDYVFIKIFHMGTSGAGLATGLGYSLTMIIGIIIFSNPKNLLHFTKPNCDLNVLKKVISNGCSEMATALVSGITTLLFNWTLLHYVGEEGIAAITIIMYVLMFVSSLFTGYTYGVAPMISYYYGEDNKNKLKLLIQKSLKTIMIISILAIVISFVVTKPLVSIFTSPNDPVYNLAVTGNKICSIALIFIGFNIFSSGMFTALNNGIVSAVLAFMRSFVFMVVCLIVLPKYLGITGIWLATPFAEILAIIFSFMMYKKYKYYYGY